MAYACVHGCECARARGTRERESQSEDGSESNSSPPNNSTGVKTNNSTPLRTFAPLTALHCAARCAALQRTTAPSLPLLSHVVGALDRCGHPVRVRVHWMMCVCVRECNSSNTHSSVFTAALAAIRMKQQQQQQHNTWHTRRIAFLLHQPHVTAAAAAAAGGGGGGAAAARTQVHQHLPSSSLPPLTARRGVGHATGGRARPCIRACACVCVRVCVRVCVSASHHVACTLAGTLASHTGIAHSHRTLASHTRTSCSIVPLFDCSMVL